MFYKVIIRKLNLLFIDYVLGSINYAQVGESIAKIPVKIASLSVPGVPVTSVTSLILLQFEVTEACKAVTSFEIIGKVATVVCKVATSVWSWVRAALPAFPSNVVTRASRAVTSSGKPAKAITVVESVATSVSKVVTLVACK